MKSGWTCHILHHPLWPLPHKWIWHGKCNNKFWTQTPSPEACVKAITIECTPFNTCETFSYLIYFQGNLEIWFVKSIGCFQMYPHIRGHTNSQLPSVCDYVCLSKPIHCLCRPTFIYRSKELISIWLKGLWIAFCTAKFLGFLLFQVPRLFISLFLLQWGGLGRSGSPAISPRCTLPSCCFALIKKLLDKRRGCTESLVRKQHSSHWGTARRGNGCRLALSQSHFCYVRHYSMYAIPATRCRV